MVWVLLVTAFFLEGIITSLPLILTSLLLFFTYRRSNRVFLAAFGVGILIDVLKLRQLGISSTYYIIFLFLVSLYERKFEIKTIPFVIIVSFLGSLGYLALVNSSEILFRALVSSILAVTTFHVTANLFRNPIRSRF
ncbi:MAG: hypothetical protein A3F31_04180 [Candidatus Levybacteria bacterium RIFCSPHIGHO2_12_FULL_38_12]|nr:MAG: hypothetical protein A3F31_04180 [Candidatus Levybacteria bacterium RIFCSPHIGHO2_12_FULL_38_12]OGH34395.1 MAG: hypothetical protein A3A47_04575 [Candidatus Levybacteria bacterium RIFCSPLOWO2_01_FULL_37_20]OGH44421.1 MAG: hypothetical protein A3J14_03135 [Candidatus Levybacteria bacterium RIFCSPLOWO2_02_FULL_37_18]OGH51458.1 MAG: hypothetical protein A3G13_01695 [Candidatus Levybacteria bacterium RIFCSPLOWO2_12_FULL_37_7]